MLFVCEANDTDYDCGLLLVLLYTFCAGRQLRLRMLRSGMMQRGCGRPVRTLRTFSYDRAAPIAPALCFLCAKEMTPVIWWPAFGATFLLIRIALSAHAATRHDASGLRTARAHVAHLL